MAVKIRR